ncbi:hypothetical protein [Paenibacillus agaridevorans]|uniref:hypothetical protein n=1 Tax=Paenibacillus agaridevorans TaxID=171404 RepID=UPI001FE7DBD7|nr:hypothetical protein [Paenibacillus agaridevorans]
MKPSIIPHANYQQLVLQQLQTAFGVNGTVLINKDWPLVLKCCMNDLSSLTSFMQDHYSAQGPAPRDPASLFRSYLLLLMTNPTMGLTEWINEMKRTRIYVILSGFASDDVPGVGTYYDYLRAYGQLKTSI